jgi:oligosaccharide 4-alpha-D-glucosyltransferase
MNKKTFVSFLFVILGFLCYSQTKTVQLSTGKWTFQQYTTHIIKVTYQPKGYSTNENISDAVILKSTVLNPTLVKINGDTITIGNARLVGTHQTNEYRGFRFLLREGERISGGGERALPLDRRGYRLNLYNAPAYAYGEGTENLNYSVPFFTSSNGYGLLFDNPAKGYVDIGKSNTSLLEYGTCSGELNVYILSGNDYKDILSSYCQLTGTQPLPPRWALGNLMSRFGYTSQSQVTEIAAKMNAAKIPFDAVIFDLFWFGDSIKGTIGNLNWVNKTKWPDPAGMIRDFRKNGINTILITEPYIVKSSLTYTQSKPFLAVDSTGKTYDLADFYFGNGGLIDLFRKDARDWFWQYYKKQMNNGVEAWWGDLGEPERHPADLYHNLRDLGYKRLFKADEVHNIYGHNWTKMLYMKYAAEYPNKRLFSLNRSGFAGTQRYSIFPWSGDVGRTWSGFRAQLPVMLGMSMSGIPYAHSDAGGFAGGEGDNELFVRWLQFADFSPILKPHGTAVYEVDKQAFSFPSEAALIEEPYREIARQAILRRYQMLPYNYTLSYRQAKYGEPLVRPLYYEYSKDNIAVTTEDELLWGDEILVAPVIHKGETSRKVYLPAGEWYYEGSNSLLLGGSYLDWSVRLTDIPVFIKAGSIIPLAPIGAISNTKDLKNDTSLVWHYYTSAQPSDYTLYEDDGESKNALSSHQYELITFKVRPTGTGYRF